MRTLLKLIYGSDITGIKSFNFIYNLGWTVSLILHLTGIIAIFVPRDFLESAHVILVECSIGTVLAFFALMFHNVKKKAILTYVSLLIGALIQLLIAIKYISVYPPLSPIVILNLITSIWLSGGAFYFKYLLEQEEKENGIN